MRVAQHARLRLALVRLAVAAVLALALSVIGSAQSPDGALPSLPPLPALDSLAPLAALDVPDDQVTVTKQYTVGPVGSGGTPLSCNGTTVICVTQSGGAATQDGTSGHEHSIAWLNTSGNWAASGNTSKVEPGDTVWLSGNFTTGLAVAGSGTLSQPVNILANGSVTDCSLSFASISYVRVIGLTIDGNGSGCSNGANLVVGTGTNTGLEFWNVTVQNTTGKAYFWDYASAFDANTYRCDKCIWHGGTVTNINQAGTSGQTGIGLSGDDTYVGYLSVSNICYIGISPTGTRGRYIGNNFSGMVACGGTHPDFFYINGGGSILGWSFNLVEGTFGLGTPTSNNNKFHHQQNEWATTWHDTVYRFNATTNLGSGVYSIYSTGTSDNLRTYWYNNTWVLNLRAVTATGACGSGNASTAGTTVTVFMFNELYYECWSADVSTNLTAVWGFAGGSGTLTITPDYNLAFDPDGTDTFISPWTTQVHKQTNADPKFNNVGADDFTIQNTSLAKGNGGPITTANGSGSSSTSLTVQTGFGGAFFGDNSANLSQYGGVLVPGDWITVNTTTVQVSSVSGDVLTLATPITWANNDPIYIGTETSHDIGAYPYKSGGYTLSGTYHQSGSTVTVTPNDATLARYAVVFENLIPSCIASAANSWACTVGSGVVTVWLYSRYPSQTQYVQATGT